MISLLITIVNHHHEFLVVVYSVFKETVIANSINLSKIAASEFIP
jgi:hypothetical protein